MRFPNDIIITSNIHIQIVQYELFFHLKSYTNSYVIGSAKHSILCGPVLKDNDLIRK